MAAGTQEKGPNECVRCGSVGSRPSGKCSDPVQVCEVPDFAHGWPSVSFGNVNRAPSDPGHPPPRPGPEEAVDRVRLGEDEWHRQVWGDTIGIPCT